MELLSNKIRELRFKNSEMTQKALAERVGISRQTINAVENCHHAPTVSVAIRIADVFSITIDELFSLDYDGKPARIEQPARPAVDQSRAPIKEPIRAADDLSQAPIKEPVEVEAEHDFGLADLRNIIGS